MEEGKRKILVIGLDGASFDFINPLLEVGKCPNFRRLMKEGVWAPLQSTIPPATPPAWASFMTGKNPGKHGVYNFFHQLKGTYQVKLVSGLSVRTTRFWEILEKDGKRIGLIDIPLTFPPQKVNGFMISGMPVPSEECNFTYPSSLHIELIRECGDYPLEERVIRAVRSGDYLETLRQLYLHTEKRKEATLYLLKKFDWDFFMVVFRIADLLQHRALRFLDEGYCQRHPLEFQKFGQVIPQFYEKIDEIIGNILSTLDEDCFVMIMSDHGAGPLRKNFYINKWLREEGFLKLKDEVQGLKSSGFRIRFSRSTKIKEIEPADQIDWSQTKAYSSWMGDERIVRINVKGREPQGIVERGREYENLRDLLIQKLLSIKDPDSGEPIIERVYKREEIYKGPFLEEAPDLQIMSRENSYSFRGDLNPERIFFTPETLTPATHRSLGLFLMSGKGIKKGVELTNVCIMDLAPTILYLMGPLVPQDMDGRVLLEAFEDSFKESNPVKYGEETIDLQEKEVTVEDVYSAEERKRVEESLRGLGYVD